MIPLLTLEGTPYEIGRQHGQQVQSLRPLLADVMAARMSALRRIGADHPAALTPAKEALEEYDRPLLEFLTGLAESLELAVADLLIYTLSSYLRDLHTVGVLRPQTSVPDAAYGTSGTGLVDESSSLQDGCTSWAASGRSTADGRPILAKTRDYHSDHIPLQILSSVSPADGYRFLSLGSAGSPHVFSSGINERGLAIADTHVLSQDIGPGLPRFSLMREVLAHHDTTQSALDYLRSMA
jgi:isopenicillin-N N-acyltransferase like protein